MWPRVTKRCCWASMRTIEQYVSPYVNHRPDAGQPERVVVVGS
ncbi:hypothetical protein STRTUCAR8_07465 [Streptomyces turgidiscabies Car8]|uniref:Uncharacterized protein n=1 Tax=Streptomyces turgidiscabies (strain Car8) TaxID=698760 RepID=L7EWU1_STRT8|nr:hypothetical protein STRTUCAR8_07465 [Streptomyces turgidiscabies Car8]